MSEVAVVADGDDAADEVVHEGDGDEVVAVIFGTEYHEVQGGDTDAVVLLEHVTVEVLLDAVVIIGGVGQVQPTAVCAPAEGRDDGTALWVAHFAAALPVVDGKSAVSILTDHVNGSCDIQVFVKDGPLLPVRANLVVVDEMEELLVLALYADGLGLSAIAEVAGGLEAAVLEVVLRLFVDKGAYAAGLASYALPLGERLSNGYSVAVLLLLRCTLGVEGLEEKGDERADGQQLVLSSVQVDVAFGQEVDVVVLWIAPCICKAAHLCIHSLAPVHRWRQQILHSSLFILHLVHLRLHFVAQAFIGRQVSLG